MDPDFNARSVNNDHLTVLALIEVVAGPRELLSAGWDALVGSDAKFLYSREQHLLMHAIEDLRTAREQIARLTGQPMREWIARQRASAIALDQEMTD